MQLSITSCREDQADQLDIMLSDTDGKLAIPPASALLRVWLGWSDTGLVDMGSFNVDEVEHAGAPDVITIRARSAHITSNLRTQREASYDATTIGAIVNTLAGRNGLTPRCSHALAAVAVSHLDQTSESDLNLLNRLGKLHDACATIKAGALIFAPIGSPTTATGKAVPGISITRRDGDRHRYLVAGRETSTAVRATWVDTPTGKKMHATVGTNNGKGVKTVRVVAPTKAEAEQIAAAEYARRQRGAASMEYQLARGRPDIYPQMRVTLAGFKPEIDATRWLVDRATHRLDTNGLITELQLQNVVAAVPAAKTGEVGKGDDVDQYLSDEAAGIK